MFLLHRPVDQEEDTKLDPGQVCMDHHLLAILNHQHEPESRENLQNDTFYCERENLAVRINNIP